VVKIDKNYEFKIKNSPEDKSLSYILRLVDYDFLTNDILNNQQVINVIYNHLHENQERYMKLSNKDSYTFKGNSDFKINKGTERETNFGFKIGFSPNLTQFLKEKKSTKVVEIFINQLKNNFLTDFANMKSGLYKRQFYEELNSLNEENSFFNNAFYDYYKDDPNFVETTPKFDTSNPEHIQIMDIYIKKQLSEKGKEKIEYTKSFYINNENDKIILKPIFILEENEKNIILEKLGYSSQHHKNKII
jgi:hypothetical protein